MKSLRILHVTPYSPRAWAYGGIPRVVGALTREQARRGHRVTVCATDVATATQRLMPGRWRPHQAFFEHGVEMRIFPNISNRFAYDWQSFLPLGLSRYLQGEARSFDVAHLHAHRNLPGVIAARHLWDAGVPYVLAPNGTAPRIERRLAIKRVFDWTVGRKVVAQAAAIVAVSEAERRQLVALGIAPSRIRLVPNPLELAEFDDCLGLRPNKRSRESLQPGSAPVVLFLGKLTPRKRVDVLIRSFAALGRPDARLVIAGNDMGAGGDARALVTTLGLSKQTTFTGLLEGANRLRALAGATVVVYPSAHEVFGLVALESILCGTPVVVADDSGCGEIIGDAGGGLTVPLGNVDALTRAISCVLDGPDRWQLQIAKAQSFVRARYSPAAVVDTLDSLYTNVVGLPTLDRPGISFVVPVRNGAPWLGSTLEAIWADQSDCPFEIIVVDDGSEDGSMAVAQAAARGRPMRVIPGPGRGAAAALNVGFRAARFPIVCQVDQDVVIRRGWTQKLVAALEDPRVAAAQARYTLDRSARLAARVMALDLEQRYRTLGRLTDHVCTGNTAYRADSVHAVGLFDETLGYGYDNDLSYRLRQAGHRLTFVRDAMSEHHWRDSFTTYLQQQYGFGYGRLDVVAKHPTRARGDSVSGTGMMLHPVGLTLGLTLLFLASVFGATHGPATPTALAGGTILASLVLERVVAGVWAGIRFGDAAGLFFPLWHLARDAAWVVAMGVWVIRRAVSRRPDPTHSMRPRSARRAAGNDSRVALPADLPAPTRVIGIIPAHNERTLLPSVLGEIRTHHPTLDLLVVDDGSTDGTAWLLDELRTSYVRLPERMGVGSAMRTGLAYASKRGYDAAVRLDGDGQHRPEDIDRLLAPIIGQQADVVLGSRYTASEHRPRGLIRPSQRLLALCLSAVTGSPVTDPTSGYCAIGPRAMRLLAEHHPTGYPEPELRLFLNRNGLKAVEVAVGSRSRLAGRSSLTLVRLVAAGGRVLLAILTVPFRQSVVYRRD